MTFKHRVGSSALFLSAMIITACSTKGLQRQTLSQSGPAGTEVVTGSTATTSSATVQQSSSQATGSSAGGVLFPEPNTLSPELCSDYLRLILPVQPSQSRPVYASCAVAKAYGVPSGTVLINFGTLSNPFPMEVFCEQNLQGGGWAMVYNSVGNRDALSFFQIPYAQRLLRRGYPARNENFYDGSMYSRGLEYLDAIEDLSSKEAIGLHAQALSFDPSTMSFSGATKIQGIEAIFVNHFAGGWSSMDYDHDMHTTANCSSFYSNISQHYNGCWAYNLGSDAEAPLIDAGWGPHVYTPGLTVLGLSNDGSGYSRVNRITRYVRW